MSPWSYLGLGHTGVERIALLVLDPSVGRLDLQVHNLGLNLALMGGRGDL